MWLLWLHGQDFQRDWGAKTGNKGSTSRGCASMPTKGRRRPPGPIGLPILGMALKIRRDPLNILRTFAREYGDIVLFHVLMKERILLNHPDFVEQVLVIQQDKSHKSELTRRITERMLGQGLMTSEGDF